MIKDKRGAILAALEEDDLTSPQIAQLLKIHPNTTEYHVKLLHKNKLIHVVDYKRSWGTKGSWAKIYRKGPGKDARPPKSSQSLYSKRYYEKCSGLIRARVAAKNGKSNPFAQLCLTPSNSLKDR